MNCKKCIYSEFVHADLYCNGCKDKPKPEIKTGRAYLFRNGFQDPVHSVEIKAPMGLEYQVAAVELMRKFRIEFIENG